MNWSELFEYANNICHYKNYRSNPFFVGTKDMFLEMRNQNNCNFTDDELNNTLSKPIKMKLFGRTFDCYVDRKYNE